MVGLCAAPQQSDILFLLRLFLLVVVVVVVVVVLGVSTWCTRNKNEKNL